MIRGGGPEAWRHLDLADEAQSKPLRCPFFCFIFFFFLSSFFLSFLPSSFNPSLSLFLCVSRAPLVVARAGSLAHPTLLAIHDQFTSRSSTILRADLDLRKIEPCAIALPRSTNPFLRSGAFLESRELSKTVGNVAEFSKVSFQKNFVFRYVRSFSEFGSVGFI